MLRLDSFSSGHRTDGPVVNTVANLQILGYFRQDERLFTSEEEFDSMELHNPWLEEWFGMETPQHPRHRPATSPTGMLHEKHNVQAQ
jgi:hypothetical protein